jgi:hypothetical protein
VPLWRRKEPLHVRLARAGGLVAGSGRPFPWDEVGIHGVQRPREWDAVVTVEAPELKGDEASFVALADGDLVVDASEGDLSPLADALEEALSPPYRAVAIRRGATRWAVAAKTIVVAELPEATGEELELVLVSAGERTLRVDGEQAFGRIPELEALARGASVVRARRIEGSLWEVQVDPL